MGLFTSLTFVDLDGSVEGYDLPTIQSLSIPDNSKVPSKSTVTGQYRQQHTLESPTTVTITMFLENGSFNGSTINVAKMVDLFDYLKKNRIMFSITTSHKAEEARFLHDLIIESVSYSREKSIRGRLVCTLKCTQIKTVELTWEKVSSLDLFGYEFLTAIENDNTVNMDFTIDSIDVLKPEETLSSNAVDWVKNEFNALVRGESMQKQTPVSQHIGNHVHDHIPGWPDTYFAQLSSHIDMRGSSNKKYACKSSFKTTRFNGSNPYTVDLATIGINVTVDSGVETKKSIPIRHVMNTGMYSDAGFSEEDKKVIQRTKVNFDDTTKYVYNFAETYPSFSGGRSFEYIEDTQSISEYLNTNVIFTKDDSRLGHSSTVLYAGGEICTYMINEKYDVQITCANFTSDLMEPTGGFDIHHFNIDTINNGWKPNFGDFQDDWNNVVTTGNEVNYDLHIIVAFLGSMMQVYLFCPTVLQEGLVA